MLTPEQLLLVEAIVTSGTLRAACRKANVPERTARDWRKLSEFVKALDLARQEAFREAVGRLKGLAGKAVGTLSRKLQSDDDSVAVRAAIALLKEGVKAVELDELIVRVEALERARGRVQ
jgi:hypothetical protein